jgi:AraC family transcriptional regulator of adaptative response/methylated-DNA-[protein]-cysteine methyltransferase
MFVCATERGVCLLEFTDRRMLETEFRDIQRLFNARIVTGENSHTRQTVKEIGEYFAGTRRQFDLALDAPGSDFQQSVWHALRAVPYGQTSHYQAISLRLNKPNAVRAVAAANGANRIAIVIPCHRIIGKDGAMTGYGGGFHAKNGLLSMREIMFNGVMLLCRREILRTSRDMLRVQKSPQGLRRAGFQDFISRLW